MHREPYDELVLHRSDVRLLASTRFWLKYRLPKRLVRWNEKPVCIGQKQKWYLLTLCSDKSSHIEFSREGHPEFDDWRWVSYWYPVRQVVAFKRYVYRKLLTFFSQDALLGRNLFVKNEYSKNEFLKNDKFEKNEGTKSDKREKKFGKNRRGS